MSKISEKYQLMFINTKSGNINIKSGKATDLTDGTNIGHLLYFIKDVSDCDDMISELDFATIHQDYHDNYPLSDGISIEISNKSTLIDNVVSVPNENMKVLILEWRKFLETP